MIQGRSRRIPIAAIGIVTSIIFGNSPLLWAQTTQTETASDVCSFSNVARSDTVTPVTEAANTTHRETVSPDATTSETANPETINPETANPETANSETGNPETATAATPDQVETILLLGNLPEAPYVVVVPGGSEVALDTVRQCVPDAFQTRSASGNYIRAGAFARRSQAERLSHYLRSLKLDARVMYFP